MSRETKWLCVILIAAAAYFSLIFNRGINVVDEGWFLHKSQMIWQGRLPYRDHFSVATPGTLYVQAGLLALSGGRVIAVRSYALLQALVSVLLAFYIARFFLKAPYSYIAPALFIPWSLLVFYRGANYNVDSSFFALLGLFFLLNHERRGGRVWFFLSALSAGLVIIFKQNIGAVMVLFTLYVVFTGPGGEGQVNGLKNRVLRVFQSGVIMSLPLMGFVVYFSMEGALIDFLQLAVLRSLRTKEGWMFTQLIFSVIKVLLPVGLYLFLMGLFSHYLAGWLEAGRKSLARGWLLFIFILHALIVGVAIYYVGNIFNWLLFTAFVPLIIMVSAFRQWRRDSRINGASRRSLGITMLFATVFYIINILSGIGFAHTLIGFYCSLLLLGYVLEAKKRLWSRLLPVAAPGAMWAIVALVGAIGFVSAITNRPEMFFAQEPMLSSRSAVDFPSMNGMRVTEELKQEMEGIYNEVVKETAKDEPILIFPLGSFYHFLTERPPAYFQEFFFFEYFFADQQGEVIRALEDQNVRLVILPARDGELGHQLDAGYLQEIYSYIYKHYRAGAVCGRYQVFLRDG